MRQATIGGVDICHAIRKKRNLLSYGAFLLVSAARTGHAGAATSLPLHLRT